MLCSALQVFFWQRILYGSESPSKKKRSDTCDSHVYTDCDQLYCENSKMALNQTEETWNLSFISDLTLFLLDFVEDLHLKSIWSWKCHHKTCTWIQKYSSQSAKSWPEGLAPYLSSLEKTKAQEKSLQFTEFQFILASWHRSLGKEHVMTHEKMNLLTGQLQTRLGHRKPHAVHSVTVFCNFKSVLVPPPHVSPRIPIPIIGYVQLQSSIAHTMTHFQTLNGSLFPAVLHITQIFYGTLALQRTQKGLGSCFPCSASWHSTMEDAML